MKNKMKISSWIVFLAIIFGTVGNLIAAGPIDFISAPNRIDMVDDTAHNILYISCSDGNLLRYNLANKSFLSPIALGGKPCGMDISPDGKTLLVANTAFDSTNNTNWIDVVNLSSGSTRRISFPLNPYESGTYTAAFVDNQTALVSSTYQGTGGVPLRKVDLIKGTAQAIVGMQSGTMLAASADHSVIGYAEPEYPNGAGRYRNANGSFAIFTPPAPWLPTEIGVSRNGKQYATPTYNGTYIYNENLQQIGLIGNYASKGPIGVAYSPTSDIVYFSWYDYSGNHYRIDAYNTNTLSEISVIDSKGPLQSPGNAGAFLRGRLRTSSDGTLLFASIDNGVNVYAVPEPCTLALLGMGGIGLIAYCWRRRK